MKKYHYIDDRGDISDALPLAALQKIGLPPTTKVLVEGGKQWINLAEAMAGGSVVAPAPPLPPTPPPSVAAPRITAEPPPSQDLLATPFTRALADFKRASADLNQPVVGAKGFLKGALKGCLFFVIGFPILIWVLAYLADHGFGRAKVSDGGSEPSPTREQIAKKAPTEEIWTNVSSTTGKTIIFSGGPGQQTLVGIGRRHTVYLFHPHFISRDDNEESSAKSPHRPSYHGCLLRRVVIESDRQAIAFCQILTRFPDR